MYFPPLKCGLHPVAWFEPIEPSKSDGVPAASEMKFQKTDCLALILSVSSCSLARSKLLKQARAIERPMWPGIEGSNQQPERNRGLQPNSLGWTDPCQHSASELGCGFFPRRWPQCLDSSLMRAWSQRTQLSYIWIPDPQKLWVINMCCFKLLNLRVIFKHFLFLLNLLG